MSNNRRNFRCPTTDFPEAKILVREDKKTVETNIHIFDESAGGFSAFVPTTPPFEAGDTVAMEYSDKELLCKISYLKAEPQGIYRFGLQVVDEIEEAPEKKNVSSGGRTTYFTSSTSVSPLLVAFVVFVISLAGFLYYESTKEYTDEFGRKYKGSPKTAFENLYQTVFGEAGNKKKK